MIDAREKAIESLAAELYRAGSNLDISEVPGTSVDFAQEPERERGYWGPRAADARRPRPRRDPKLRERLRTTHAADDGRVHMPDVEGGNVTNFGEACAELAASVLAQSARSDAGG